MRRNQIYIEILSVFLIGISISPKVTLDGVPRTLANLEKNGELWRRFGKGTFFSAKPIDELSFEGRVAEQYNPMEVMSA